MVGHAAIHAGMIAFQSAQRSGGVVTVDDLKRCRVRKRLLDDLLRHSGECARSVSEMVGLAATAHALAFSFTSYWLQVAKTRALLARATLLHHERRHGCKPSGAGYTPPVDPK